MPDLKSKAPIMQKIIEMKSQSTRTRHAATAMSFAPFFMYLFVSYFVVRESWLDISIPRLCPYRGFSWRSVVEDYSHLLLVFCLFLWIHRFLCSFTDAVIIWNVILKVFNHLPDLSEKNVSSLECYFQIIITETNNYYIPFCLCKTL